MFKQPQGVEYSTNSSVLEIYSVENPDKYKKLPVCPVLRHHTVILIYAVFLCASESQDAATTSASASPLGQFQEISHTAVYSS